MPTQRQERVGNLLQREISDIMRREIGDPHVGFATLTGVEVSPDLRHATLYVSVLGDARAKRDTMRALIRARRYIRTLLAARLDLRYVPELVVRLDETAERAQRMEQLLRGIAQDRPSTDEPNE